MMIRLYPEQLRAQLTEGLRAAYLLLGNDPLLLQESQDAIREAAAAQGFTEHHTFSIDNSTDWQAIFALSQAMSLFASRQTLLLILPENGPNAAINEQLAMLVGLLHDDLLLIVRGNKLTKAQENAAWLTALAQRAVQVSCQTPEYAQLPRWLAARAKQHQLQLDDAASQLLCYCYEGNLLALAQALERLALLWPDGKLTLPRVEQAVNDAAHFTIGSMPYWQAKVSACCTSCSSYALKAASRRSCCVLCSGSCCCWLPSSARRRTRRCARCLINTGSGKTAVSCSATPSRA